VHADRRLAGTVRPSVRPRILFLSHSASLNGATILLLHLITWLKAHCDCEMEVLVNGPGPLVDEFKGVARTTVWRNVSRLFSPFHGRASARARAFLELQYMRSLIAGRHFDLIYANTCATWPQIKLLANSGAAVLWHVHELSYALRLSLGYEDASAALRVASRFIVVSGCVQAALADEFGVPRDKIDTVHGFVPLPAIDETERLRKRQRVRCELEWPEDAFVVLGCGSLGWRKGTDLFLQIARSISSTDGYERVRFLWVGGDVHGKESLEFAHDELGLGLSRLSARISNTSHVLDYYCAADLFLLTSREDPFPLVMLEAASLGIPVGCFAHGGGAAEFIGEDAGFIVPYLDTTAFANKIMFLHDHPEQRMRLGAAARERVKSSFCVEAQAPKILKSIERCLRLPPASDASVALCKPRWQGRIDT